MCAGEHQRETVVGDFRARRRGVQHLGEDLQLRGRNLAAAAASGAVDHLAAGDGQKPGFRVRREAVQRPIRQRRSEGLRQRVFGLSHIPRPGHEKGDELAVAATRDRISGTARLRVAFA
jgi:hypothetical protein